MVKSVGKPDARNGHVRFDERGRETGGCQEAPHRALPRLYVITEFVLESKANAFQFQTELAKHTAEFHSALSETQRHLHRRILLVNSQERFR